MNDRHENCLSSNEQQLQVSMGSVEIAVKVNSQDNQLRDGQIR